MMRTMHIEAIHRLLRCDWLPLLEPYDLETFSTEYQPVGQDEAEYDFRDFRFAKLERARRYSQPHQALGSEALLEFRDDREDSPASIIGGDVRGVSDVRSRPNDEHSARNSWRDGGGRPVQHRGRDSRADYGDMRGRGSFDSSYRADREREPRDGPSTAHSAPGPSYGTSPLSPLSPQTMPAAAMPFMPSSVPPPATPNQHSAHGVPYGSTPAPQVDGAHPWLALFDPTAGQQGLDDLSWMFAATPPAPVPVPAVQAQVQAATNVFWNSLS